MARPQLSTSPDILHLLLTHVADDPAALASAEAVCRAWRAAVRSDDALWRPACLRLHPLTAAIRARRLEVEHDLARWPSLKSQRGWWADPAATTWRRMFRQHTVAHRRGACPHPPHQDEPSRASGPRNARQDILQAGAQVGRNLPKRKRLGKLSHWLHARLALRSLRHFPRTQYARTQYARMQYTSRERAASPRRPQIQTGVQTTGLQMLGPIGPPECTPHGRDYMVGVELATGGKSFSCGPVHFIRDSQYTTNREHENDLPPMARWSS
jgi:hypothetical protein